jgi:hypothetical protein
VDISNLWFAFRRPSSTPPRRHKRRNGLGPPTRKTMRANMVAALPLNHFTHQARNAFVKIARQALGYLGISCLLPDQIRLETTAENRIHAVGPKTWLKVRPESFPDTRSSSRRVRSALIASSVRESPSRLCTNNFARAARSAGASESASSATARFVIAIGIKYLPAEAAQVKLPGGSSTALMGGEGKRPREPKLFRAVRARGDARPPGGGSGAQGVDQLIWFVRQRRVHVSLNYQASILNHSRGLFSVAPVLRPH